MEGTIENEENCCPVLAAAGLHDPVRLRRRLRAGGVQRLHPSRSEPDPGTGSERHGPRRHVSAPDTSAPDVSVPDASSPDAGQSGGGTSAPEKSTPEAPPAAVKPANPPKPQVTKPEPKPEPKPDPAPDQSQPATEPDPAPQPDAKPAPTKEAASAYIGKSVSSLIAAIGQPGGSDYAPSCLGDGEDGELFYDGFTVYTYRENGKETVQAVE